MGCVPWTTAEDEWMRANYPALGQKISATTLGRSKPSIRMRASRLGLRVDPSSDHAKEWQSRAAHTKVGRKRPDQAAVINKTRAEGKMDFTLERCESISKRMKEIWRTRPHPRGMAGKKHSAETLRKLSENNWWNTAPESEVEKAKDKLSEIMAARGKELGNISVGRQGASWKCGWRVVGDKKIYFRSRWEVNYALYLEHQKTIGSIVGWEYEKETFWFKEIKRGCVSYLPDFKVTFADGAVEYHEVKGWMDDRSKTKIKRMAQCYPGVVLKIIDKKWFKANNGYWSSRLLGWENKTPRSGASDASPTPLLTITLREK